jgi:PhzF family phenazine biosynthesis protein
VLCLYLGSRAPKVGEVKLKIFQVDAFADAVFKGNPAAVCPLTSWLDGPVMQGIALENNLSETAFLVPAAGQSGRWQLRWFTPKNEIDLCGHATLASAYVLFEILREVRGKVAFDTRSGELVVSSEGDRLSMSLPSRPPAPCEAPAGLAEALGANPREVLAARDLLVLLDSAATVRGLNPDIGGLERIDRHAVIVTAPGEGDVDFVSRFFAPRQGVAEDPVTGSAHCTLVPFWSKRLKKSSLHALQVSARGGELWCEDAGERVLVAGRAVRYLEGEIYI